MRDDSGWKMAEPMPTKAAASSTVPKFGAKASNNNPHSVQAMPQGSEYGSGRLSVYRPMSGCSSEAVSWKVSVMSPIWPKLRWKSPFRIGYIARISDCIMSLIMCEVLRAPSTPKEVFARVVGVLGVGDRVAAEIGMVHELCDAVRVCHSPSGQPASRSGHVRRPLSVIARCVSSN